jgi:hypothetical protein
MTEHASPVCAVCGGMIPIPGPDGVPVSTHGYPAACVHARRCYDVHAERVAAAWRTEACQDSREASPADDATACPATL